MFHLFSAALAESTEAAPEIAQAAAGGVVTGMAFTTLVALLLVWYILQAIADWKILTKAGVAGWKSLIPFLNTYEEYNICWNGVLGLLYPLLTGIITVMSNNANSDSGLWNVIFIILGLICLVIHIMQSLRLSKAFGKGAGFAIGLILFGPIFRIVLGLGSARYVGKPE